MMSITDPKKEKEIRADQARRTKKMPRERGILTDSERFGQTDFASTLDTFSTVSPSI